MPGYVEGALALSALLALGGGAIWLVNLGKKVEKAALLEEEQSGHEIFHNRGEEFDRGGGLRGAVRRARARRAERLRKAQAERDV